jgi:DNA-binding NarL/FixJ family response regulator
VIRVLIVDDHPLIRAGLITMLAEADDIHVVAEAPDGLRAIAAAHEHTPDVALMDLSMPVLDGIAATRRLSAELPQIRIVALTSFSDRQRVNDALTAGAVGYLLKDSTPDDVLDAIRAAAAGHAPLDPRVASVLLPARSGTPVTQLSAREVEVLRLAAEGMANKQIARRLGISEGTVKVHLGSVFRTIGVADRTSAALWAKEHLPAT